MFGTSCVEEGGGGVVLREAVANLGAGEPLWDVVVNLGAGAALRGADSVTNLVGVGVAFEVGRSMIGSPCSLISRSLSCTAISTSTTLCALIWLAICLSLALLAFFLSDLSLIFCFVFGFVEPRLPNPTLRMGTS